MSKLRGYKNHLLAASLVSISMRTTNHWSTMFHMKSQKKDARKTSQAKSCVFAYEKESCCNPFLFHPFFILFLFLRFDTKCNGILDLIREQQQQREKTRRENDSFGESHLFFADKRKRFVTFSPILLPSVWAGANENGYFHRIFR